MIHNHTDCEEDKDKSVYKDNDDKNNSVILTNADQAIIVSDIHIGYEKSNVRSFINFLDQLVSSGKIKDYSFFILGDLFDLWRRRDVIFYPESDRILSLINQFKHVYYIPGNHDYTILDATEQFPDFNCYNISKYFRVKSDNTTFFLLHGHELEVISKLPYLKI